MRTVVVSDMHLGSAAAADLLRRSDMRAVLWDTIEGADHVILLGDVVELRDRPFREALAAAEPFFSELRDVLGGTRLTLVPGNHDHHLISSWLERRRLDGTGPLGTSEEVPCNEGPLAEMLGVRDGTCVEVRYPGAWLGDGVYATHGHYLDRHLTIPTFERLAVAAVERILGQRRGADSDPDPDSATPDDYEHVQAPVYEFLFALAQAGQAAGNARGGPSARVWQTLGGGYGRAAKMRGRLLGTVAVPGAVGVANRLGLGPVRADLSPGAISRAGLAAIAEVVRRLGIEAGHVIFGHTHRRGPMPGESGWRLPEGTRLWNTGSWVYVPGIAGRRPGASPYWPGTVAVVDDGEPALLHLLDDRGASELDTATG